MGCGSCQTAGGGLPRGCNNNGNCSSGGCEKLSVFDWLSNMQLPEEQKPFDKVEVRFKNGRKDFFYNKEGLTLSMGDTVATEAQSGHDVGVVALTGELVKVQMKKKKVNPERDDLPVIYRKASQRDLDKWHECQKREEPVKKQAREIAIDLNLAMKISDVEFQGDGTKAIFYYTAESRVDFRQLIKEFARSFKIRIEMKQVGYRQEAARLGGIGSCGRELCCSTWLTDFRTVKTSAARYQQLSLNPQKLAGQCGKLKCCLNYELDMYQESLRLFPKMDKKLITKKGKAICQKIDIFKRKLWYAYLEEPNNWFELNLEDVQEIINKQKADNFVASLEEFSKEEDKSMSIDFENAVGQDSLTRFDQKSRKRKNKGKKRKKRNKKQ
ncbi:MAG: regulatory iron-sulfur-containing complex subunit RicT [Psychroflexus sp.]|jgi:cell fate regulator YaaT (PSP1 superfamily)|nr:regulatory iron-sulfur-containing complex subunit RicT [Psychroflexus sp.]MDR9449279.1 regulatory iron-sulfur-containing complex subunit RicT [Psychroflexus sp.]